MRDTGTTGALPSEVPDFHDFSCSPPTQSLVEIPDGKFSYSRSNKARQKNKTKKPKKNPNKQQQQQQQKTHETKSEMILICYTSKFGNFWDPNRNRWRWLIHSDSPFSAGRLCWFDRCLVHEYCIENRIQWCVGPYEGSIASLLKYTTLFSPWLYFWTCTIGLCLAYADCRPCLLAPLWHFFQLSVDSGDGWEGVCGYFADKPIVSERKCSGPQVAVFARQSLYLHSVEDMRKDREPWGSPIMSCGCGDCARERVSLQVVFRISFPMRYCKPPDDTAA